LEIGQKWALNRVISLGFGLDAQSG
jgi:hypothetical protein